MDLCPNSHRSARRSFLQPALRPAQLLNKVSAEVVLSSPFDELRHGRNRNEGFSARLFSLGSRRNNRSQSKSIGFCFSWEKKFPIRGKKTDRREKRVDRSEFIEETIEVYRRNRQSADERFFSFQRSEFVVRRRVSDERNSLDESHRSTVRFLRQIRRSGRNFSLQLLRSAIKRRISFRGKRKQRPNSKN